ncbi:interferon-induced transmembrane protein 1 isoform X1 [Oryzias latipes]|uniref:interferon-induced transmembrane protein 1 isoform X1 n=1 Tax=Oryzias latipes TaxID=8090 RepID=UPI000CE1FDED|nr:interferon-induced transmembrane protein 1 isoform X1 [Oryzias latipes]
MNPVYPNAPLSAEDVPLQGTPQHMYPGQLHTTTAAGGHNTIVLQAEPPRDHIIWSLCCFLYSNPLCLGLAALIFSIKSRDRKVAGDLEGARHYGATARCLNIAATIIACITVIIAIVGVALLVKSWFYYGQYDININSNIYNNRNYGK